MNILLNRPYKGYCKNCNKKYNCSKLFKCNGYDIDNIECENIICLKCFKYYHYCITCYLLTNYTKYDINENYHKKIYADKSNNYHKKIYADKNNKNNLNRKNIDNEDYQSTPKQNKNYFFDFNMFYCISFCLDIISNSFSY